MSRILTLSVAILSVAVIAAQDKPAAAPLELTITPMGDSVSLGDMIQVEAVLKNTSDKPVEIPPLMFDERSLSFAVKAETTPGMTKSFEYSIVTGSLYTIAPPPLEKVKLAPGKSFVSAFNLPATMVGTWMISGKFNGTDASVTSKPVTVKVNKKDGKDKLSVKLTFSLEGKDRDVFIDLLPDAAPASVMHFVSLVGRGFYKGLKVVEVVKGNWLRTGCPNNDGFGDAGYTYRSENKEQETTNKSLVFDPGVVALNQQQKMGYQSSQFFITMRRINFLDYKFTIIGKVDSESLQVVKEAGSKADPDRDTNRPKNDITVKDAAVVVR